MQIGNPTIVERGAQPYMAVRRDVVIPFGHVIDDAMAELFSGLESMKIQPSGYVFFKYDVIRMPNLAVQFAVEVDRLLPASNGLLTGILPAGRYAMLTLLGHYDHLIEANRVLIEWARAEGHAFDMRAEADGDHFTARFELYYNGPHDEPDPEKWKTDVAIRLRG